MRLDTRRHILLLNNLSSLTSQRERAEAFGSQIREAGVPRTKLFYHIESIPKSLTGEDEYMVIGGLYEVSLSRFQGWGLPGASLFLATVTSLTAEIYRANGECIGAVSRAGIRVVSISSHPSSTQPAPYIELPYRPFL